MQENYWTVIDFLVDCIINKGVDADELKNSRYRLSVALDKCLVCNFTIRRDKTPCIGLGWALQ